MPPLPSSPWIPTCHHRNKSPHAAGAQIPTRRRLRPFGAPSQPSPPTHHPDPMHHLPSQRPNRCPEAGLEDYLKGIICVEILNPRACCCSATRCSRSLTSPTTSLGQAASTTCLGSAYYGMTMPATGSALSDKVPCRAWCLRRSND